MIAGNIYAQGQIDVGETQLDNVNVMRSSSCQQQPEATVSAGGSVGIPIAGEKIRQISTERNDFATVSFSNIKLLAEPENYNYFTKRLGLDLDNLAEFLPLCANLDLAGRGYDNFKQIADGQACLVRSTLDGNVKLSQLISDIEQPILALAPDVKLVVFVEGNLLIDRNINLDQAGSLLMFIVSQDIIIDPNLGEFINENQISCRSAEEASAAACLNQNPTLRGIFIADGQIIFDSGTDASEKAPTFWNNSVSRVCDKKITVQGSFIGWGKGQGQRGITIARTFAGCVQGFRPEGQELYHSYLHDYNSCTPTVTFVYDPELLLRLPSSMRKTRRSTFEVN